MIQMILYEKRIKIKPVPYGVQTKIINGTPVIYTKPEYKKFKRMLANIVRKDYNCLIFPPLYSVDIQFNLATPKYTSKNAGDLDNLSKGILDSLQGILWANDAQIVRLSVSKQPALEYSIYLLVQGFC